MKRGTRPETTEVAPEQLYNRCDPGQFRFRTTEELKDLIEVPGQGRAVGAIEFGIGIQRPGYNLFAMGAPGSGKHSMVRRYLDRQAASRPVPSDWVYVHHFAGSSHEPRALELPAGRARKLSEDLDRLIGDLRAAIPAAFETEEYRMRRQEIEAEFNERQEKVLGDFRERARQRRIALLRTPAGLALAPVEKDEVLDAEAFQKLPKEERQKIEESMAEFQGELERILHQLPKWRREIQHKVRELNRLVTRAAVNSLIDELKKEYDGLPAVQEHLAEVQQDVVENAEDFRRRGEGETPTVLGIPIGQPESSEASLRRYRVNVLIDHGESKGAPVVYEDHPTHDNLLGRIEHLSQMGTLVTDFTLIKAGALHRANGGYLILDALKLLMQPFAWEALKRALRSREIRIQSLGQALSLVSTVSLEPQPIPLNVKVVLVGDRSLYYLLHRYDPEFEELFKVAADFEEEMDRGRESVQQFARLVGTVARQEKLLAFDRGAVARMVERSSRIAGDTRKLRVQMRPIVDLLREADHWARVAERRQVTAGDVERAVEAQEQRSGRVRERLQEAVLRGTLLVDTEGAVVGQVNGLSVLQLGGYAFGHPSRITARVRVGSGKVIDIEREVELGGPIHSKGVLILSGFFAGRYAPEQPLSFAASLGFEQSYGGVEGDSASSAELYALLSALSGLPVRQGLAVTGSVNQQGVVQAIGGVNEKIEGFFDLCRERGLTGSQGVLIPASNVQNLMLRREVVEAARAGQFHVHAVETIDQGIEILTGVKAGERGADGRFAPGSVNARVEDRLREFAASLRSFRAEASAEKP